MNPNRFLLPAAVFCAFPLGAALASLARRMHLPHAAVAPAALLAMVGVAGYGASREIDGYRTKRSCTARRGRWSRVSRSLPPPMPTLPSLQPVMRFIEEHTDPHDRLLIQTISQCEPVVVPLFTGREVIGSTYTDEFDPAQFLYDRVLGKKFADWSPGELAQRPLERVGRWVAVASTLPAVKLLTAATGEPGVEVGSYRAFRCKNVSRFLRGDGHVEVELNRIAIEQLRPADGTAVLRYRYHPAWSCADRTSRSCPISCPRIRTAFLSFGSRSPHASSGVDSVGVSSVADAFGGLAESQR